MSDHREIRFEGRELGVLTIGRIQRMMERGDIDHTAEFWSEKKNLWCPVAGVMFDIDPLRTEEMRQAQVLKVQIVGTRDDCPACQELAGKSYAIDELPELPPRDCACVPWCRSNVVAAE